MDSVEEKQFWYKSWWRILFIATFLPFVALWWIWAKSRWGRNLKLIVTGGVILLVMIASITTFISSSTQQLSIQQTAETIKNTTPTKKVSQDRIEEKTLSPIPKPERRSIAVQLAILHTGEPSPSQGIIDKFDDLLSELNEKCTEKDERKISDYIVFSKEKLEGKGIKMTLLEIATGINNSIPGEVKDQNLISCAEVATRFVLSAAR